MIDVNAAAMGIPGADAGMAILVYHVVLNIDSTEGLPENDTVGAVQGHNVVVNFHIGDGGVTGDLNAVGGIGEENVIDDQFVLAAKVQSVIEVATGAPVMVNEIGAVNVAAGGLVVKNAVLALSAGGGGISVVVDVAIEDLVVAGPNGDATFGSVFDFKAVDDVVAAIDVDTDVAIGSVLSVNDSAAFNFGLEGNGSGGGTAFAEMNSPAAVVVGVGSSLNDDGRARGRETVSVHDCAAWLGRCPGIGVTARSGNIQSSTVRVNANAQTD